MTGTATFNSLARGVVIGFSIAAPVGPIGVLIIRRTLAEGRGMGLATGLGAAAADGIYGVSQLNFARMFARSLAPQLSGDRTGAEPHNLEMLMECRSYHLGWLLYADSLVQAALARDAG